MHVGRMVVLKTDYLGNKEGDVGYIFNEFTDAYQGFMVHVIFQNGKADAFTVSEQEHFLTLGNVNPFCANYTFQNIIQVYKDYKDGYWRFG